MVLKADTELFVKMVKNIKAIVLYHVGGFKGFKIFYFLGDAILRNTRFL